MDETQLSRLCRVLPNLGSADPAIRATAAEAAHRIVTDAGGCWQDLLCQRPLQAEQVHWRHAVRLALDSETEPNEFERQLLHSLLHRNGTLTSKQQTTLGNVVSRLVAAPLRIRF
jgi:hypothetical protein